MKTYETLLAPDTGGGYGNSLPDICRNGSPNPEYHTGKTKPDIFINPCKTGPCGPFCHPANNHDRTLNF
ncbi:hypothetical protein HK22_07070 [Gluconobacter sp. DsW_056]|nr:hypothetical protein HK22_07070 [Gluconobacter sp. DsW_056]